MSAAERIITLKSGRQQRNLTRLRKWARFDFDFQGGFSSPRFYGHKTYDRDGNMVIFIWRNK